MGSELLLYGYGFVCVSMLIFNVAYSLSLKRKDRRLKNRDRRFARRVDRQLDRLRTGEGLERGHLTYLRRKLSRVNHLAAFDRMVMERLGARRRTGRRPGPTSRRSSPSSSTWPCSTGTGRTSRPPTLPTFSPATGPSGIRPWTPSRT